MAGHALHLTVYGPLCWPHSMCHYPVEQSRVDSCIAGLICMHLRVPRALSDIVHCWRGVLTSVWPDSIAAWPLHRHRPHRAPMASPFAVHYRTEVRTCALCPLDASLRANSATLFSRRPAPVRRCYPLVETQARHFVLNSKANNNAHNAVTSAVAVGKKNDD